MKHFNNKKKRFLARSVLWCTSASLQFFYQFKSLGLNFIISWRILVYRTIYILHTQSLSSTAPCHPDNLTVDAMLNISLSSPVTGWPCCPHKVLKQQQPKSSMWFWVSCWLHLLKGEIITNRDSHQGYTLKNVFNIIQRRKTCGTILQCSRSFTDIFRPSKLKKTFPQKKTIIVKCWRWFQLSSCCFAICF